MCLLYHLQLYTESFDMQDFGAFSKIRVAGIPYGTAYIRHESFSQNTLI